MSTSTDLSRGGFDLGHHGDAELGAGRLDFAVNVRYGHPPPWLTQALSASLSDLAAYPDDDGARRAVAQRHHRPPAEVLLCAGAAEAFVLIARALRPRHAVVVHPQFTEPEAALRAAGHNVDRLLLHRAEDFTLDPARVPLDADLVVIGNPTNPTSVLHRAQTLSSLARPGRTLVVDEAFMDAVPGEPESLAGRRDLPGLLVIRSLTKTWALAGLRIGYLLGEPVQLAELRQAQPRWAVSTPALAAATVCSSAAAIEQTRAVAVLGAQHRSYLLQRLAGLPAPQLQVVPSDPRAPFVLVHRPGADQIRLELRARGIAVRRGDTFPGLGPDWLRIAVRPPELTDRLISALAEVLARPPHPATARTTTANRLSPAMNVNSALTVPRTVPRTLLDTIAAIAPLHAPSVKAARERQDQLTKPAGSLGRLEDMSVQLAGLAAQVPPPMPDPVAVAVFTADHGVHAQGVTPWPQQVTAQMVRNFLAGGAVINAVAAQSGATVLVVDVGTLNPLAPAPGLLLRTVRRGTADLSVGPAMTREQAQQAIEVGIEVAAVLIADGHRCLVTGDMGIANTTASAALIAAFTGASAAEVTGRGTGIDPETLAHKIDVVARALALHQVDPADPIGVLAALGGLEHAALAGFLLGAAAARVPVILDGVIAGAAALVAQALAPDVVSALIAGHRSTEPGAARALTRLGLTPLLDLGLRLGEGSGAALAIPIVQVAARVLAEVATFDSAGVTAKD